ncbi:MAG: hypothetical protein KDI51_21360, partial [Xanthomonadales bacterium]|nr:hypothetical protein [Xanthomonadales bacterium]
MRAKRRGCTLGPSTTTSCGHAEQPYFAEQYPAIRRVETRRIAVYLLLGERMLFEIVGPVFKCADDEGIFFSRLYELPGYENVIGKGRNLYLNFSANPNEAVL